MNAQGAPGRTDPSGGAFADPRGGLYSTSDRAETLITRPKEIFDGALPSGNTAAALLFDQLDRLTGELME